MTEVQHEVSAGRPRALAATLELEVMQIWKVRERWKNGRDSSCLWLLYALVLSSSRAYPSALEDIYQCMDRLCKECTYIENPAGHALVLANGPGNQNCCIRWPIHYRRLQ